MDENSCDRDGDEYGSGRPSPEDPIDQDLWCWNDFWSTVLVGLGADWFAHSLSISLASADTRESPGGDSGGVSWDSVAIDIRHWLKVSGISSGHTNWGRGWRPGASATSIASVLRISSGVGIVLICEWIRAVTWAELESRRRIALEVEYMKLEEKESDNLEEYTRVML